MSNIISFFQKLIKGGVGIRVGGWKIFQKLISGGGDDYSVLESTSEALSSRLNVCFEPYGINFVLNCNQHFEMSRHILNGEDCPIFIPFF